MKSNFLRNNRRTTFKGKPAFIVDEGGAYYTVCDGKNHWDIMLDPKTGMQEEIVRARWTCENCKDQNGYWFKDEEERSLIDLKR